MSRSFFHSVDPTTRTSAASPPHSSADWRLTPPSTWTWPAGIPSGRPRKILCAGRILVAASFMNDCPPKPGSTVMTITMSSNSRYGSRAESGVAGLIARPACRPAFRILSNVGSIGSSTSTWKVIESQPASMNWSMYRPGSEIMRWASKGCLPMRRRRLINPGPKVMFGTKWPSMTSRWRRSAPDLSAFRESRARFERSASRMLALTRV